MQNVAHVFALLVPVLSFAAKNVLKRPVLKPNGKIPNAPSLAEQNTWQQKMARTNGANKTSDATAAESHLVRLKRPMQSTRHFGKRAIYQH
jgi:hypothetical protein